MGTRTGKIGILRLGVEAFGWFAAAFCGVAVAGNRWPRLGCRVFGHAPSAWTWATDAYEETSCCYCGIRLTRPPSVAR